MPYAKLPQSHFSDTVPLAVPFDLLIRHMRGTVFETGFSASVVKRIRAYGNALYKCHTITITSFDCALTLISS